MANPARPSPFAASSRNVSLLMLVGTVAVIVAFFFAARELRKTAAAISALRADSMELAARNVGLRRAADSLLAETEGLREGLTAARAAITAYHQGDYGAAIALYDKVIRDDSTNAYLLNLRAYSLFKAGRLEEALASQELGLRADSAYAWGYFDKARFLCALRRWDAAAQTIRDLLQMAPSMTATLNGDGEFRDLCRRVYP